MLLKNDIAKAIAAGSISTVYRCWSEPKVKPGSTLVTVAGVLKIVRVERVRRGALTHAAAQAAGYASKDALATELSRFDGTVFCITLRYHGEDPRIDLRRKSKLSAEEHREIEAKLLRFGARTAEGPWALPILRTIRDHPGTRAGDLAERHGMERLRFKARVRQLKALGLTESLEVGYRLSPRGRAVLRRLER